MDETSLAQVLTDKRWFARGERTIERVELVDHAVIDDGPPELTAALLAVHFADGADALYHVPLLVEQEGDPRDAVEDVDRLRILGDLMAHGTSLKGEHGTFHYGGPGLDPLAPPGSRSARMVGAEQSNSSIVLDDEFIVKLFRRVEPGTNPDLEINRVLTTEGFPYVPAQVGEISYEKDDDEDGEVIDLGIAQRFVRDAEEGWTHILGHVRSLFDEARDDDPRDHTSALTEERGEKALRLIEQLGDTTAAMHVALAREESEPDFAPEPVGDHDLSRWIEAAGDSVREAVQETGYGTESKEDTLIEKIDGLHGLVPELLGSKIRIHGDYHLGQVLRAPREWLLIDFEGEPLRSLEERRSKKSPLRDVAGMLRSLSYAATSVLFERARPNDTEWDRLLPWADAWEELARSRFLAAYLATSHEGHFLPSDREVLGVMLDVFEIDKALYELRYERAHRPDWTDIPLRGIEKVLERSETR